MEPLAEPPVDPEAARRAADEILARPEYQPKADSVLVRAVRWLVDHLRLPDLGGAAPAGSPGRLSPLAVSILLLLVSVALYLVYRVVRAMWREGWHRPGPDPDDDEVDVTVDTPPSSGDWASEADRLEAAGQWREALRARYRATVSRLSGAGWLRPVPGSSPGELQGELHRSLPAAGPEFAALTDAFQTVWYGGAPIDGASSATLRARVDRVVAVANTAGPAPHADHEPHDDLGGQIDDESDDTAAAGP